MAGIPHIPQGDLADLLRSSPGEAVPADALVDDGVVVADDVVVDYGGLVVNLLRMSSVQAASVLVPAAEVAAVHEGVVAVAEPEAESGADPGSVPGDADAGSESGTGGERSPPAVRAGVAECYPGRSPDRVGNPEPPVMGMEAPAAVVEGRPAPAVVGPPVPAGIAVDPGAPVVVGAPAGVDRRHRGLPDPSMSVQVEPGPIGGEGAVEDLVGDPGTFLDFLDDYRLGRRRLAFHRGGRSLRFRDSLLDGRSGGDQRSDHAVGHAKVVEVDDLVGSQAQGLGGLLHMRQQHFGADPALVHLQNFGQLGRQRWRILENGGGQDLFGCRFGLRFGHGRWWWRRSHHHAPWAGVAAPQDQAQGGCNGGRCQRRLHGTPRDRLSGFRTVTRNGAGKGDSLFSGSTSCGGCRRP